MAETKDGKATRQPQAAGKSPQAKEETLRRVKFWKHSANAASVVGFITLSGVIVTQHAGAAAKTSTTTVAQVHVPAAAATPVSTSTATAATRLAETRITAQIMPATTT